MSSSSDFLTTNDILADVLVFCNDEGYTSGLTPGWYQRRVQVALEELAMDTFFDASLFKDCEMPTNLRAQLPPGLFSLKDIFAYSGALGDPVVINPIMYKDNMVVADGSLNYTAKRKETMSQHEFYESPTSTSGVLYASRQGNQINFSASCVGYPYYRITYTGFGSAIESIPIVPRMFRQAVIDHVTVNATRALMAKDRAKQTIYTAAALSLSKTWPDAEFRAQKMDPHTRDSFGEYFRSLKMQYG
jgi:hypothetical protein